MTPLHPDTEDHEVSPTSIYLSFTLNSMFPPDHLCHILFAVLFLTLKPKCQNNSGWYQQCADNSGAPEA